MAENQYSVNRPKLVHKANNSRDNREMCPKRPVMFPKNGTVNLPISVKKMSENWYLVYHQTLGVGDGNLVCIWIHESSEAVARQNADGVEIVASEASNS
jgi:hypothetical protein